MAQQLLRSSAIGAPQRRTQPTCAFQTSKQLPIHVAPQKAIPFVSSSSPAQAARPLSRPLQSASGDNPTSPSPSPLSESNRQLAWSVVACLLTMALIATFGVLFPQTPDNRVLHAAVAVALSIRPSSQRTTPSVSSSSPARTARPLSRPLRSATDDEPTSSSPSLWAKALRQLLRPKYVDLPSSWAEGLVNMLWDAGVGLLGVAFLAYTLPRLPSLTFPVLDFLIICAVCDFVKPRYLWWERE